MIEKKYSYLETAVMVLMQEGGRQQRQLVAFVVVASIAAERSGGIDLSAAYCWHLVYWQLALLVADFQVKWVP